MDEDSVLKLSYNGKRLGIAWLMRKVFSATQDQTSVVGSAGKDNKI
jgi:hypothetical protein